jgi:hypothetical protein
VKEKNMKIKTSKSMIIMASSVLALIAGVATTPAAFAHTQRYMVGYTDGSNQAIKDYWAGDQPNASCPTRDDGSSHTSNYCAGYVDGYRAEWMGLYRNHQPTEQNKQTIEQGSSVNVKGNNNRVVVNQQANQGVDQPISGYPVYGSDGHSDKGNSGGQSNPRCIILCANVRIN